jgi:hypothetical protein
MNVYSKFFLGFSDRAGEDGLFLLQMPRRQMEHAVAKAGILSHSHEYSGTAAQDQVKIDNEFRRHGPKRS